MVDLAEGNYKKALNKATYYFGEIEEKINYGVTGFTLGLRENM